MSRTSIFFRYTNPRHKYNLYCLKKILSLVLCLVLCASFTACQEDEEESPYDQIIYYNIESEPITLDPQIADDSGALLVIMNIFEGLVRLNEDGDAEPGAAESWYASSDCTVFTFNLRHDACWSDGTPLTAADFVYGITRALSPDTNSSTASSLFCIKNAEAYSSGTAEESELGIYAEDDYTVVIELEYSYQDFPSVLASPCAMPCNQAFFESTAGQYGLEAEKILCNGAFMLSSSSGWTHYTSLTLQRNTYYSGEEEVIPSGVSITIGELSDSVVTSIEDGTVDCYAIPSDEVDEAEAAGLNLTSFDDTVWGLCFNMDDEIVSNKNIRLGLLYALDRDYILQTLPDHASATKDIIPDTAELDGQSYRSLADSSFGLDYSDSFSTYLSQGLEELELDALPSIEILCADDEATQSIVNNIIETLNAATGCYFNKNPVSSSELQDYIDSGDYTIALAPISLQGSSPLDTLSLFFSSSTSNFTNLSSTVYDNYITQIQDTSVSDSLDYIMAAEKYLNDCGIFYPLYLQSRFYASASNIFGIVFHAYGAEADFRSAVKYAAENSS